jgi:membrane-associated phospholipid phosphatase
VRLWVALFSLCTFTVPLQLAAQISDTGTPPEVSNSASVPKFDRPVSWKLLLPNILDDQKHIWSFPNRLAHGHGWVPTVAVLGVTGGLFALDPTEGNYFRRSNSYNEFNKVFSGSHTDVAMIVAPVSFYAVGFFTKDEKAQHTALLSGEAVADAEIVATVLKAATKRVRPSAFAPNGNLYDSWFESKGSPLRANGGFPSGHSIAAFSIATVVARRYGNHRWVPYVAYSAATLIGFSRMTLSAHFASDVFLGGALGYSISRFTVLRQ